MPNSGLRKKRKEIPISAGLITKGRISSTRASEFTRPARRSSSAAPSATASVAATSLVTKTKVAHSDSRNSGSSVNSRV